MLDTPPRGDSNQRVLSAMLPPQSSQPLTSSDALVQLSPPHQQEEPDGEWEKSRSSGAGEPLLTSTLLDSSPRLSPVVGEPAAPHPSFPSPHVTGSYDDEALVKVYMYMCYCGQGISICVHGACIVLSVYYV